MSEPLRVGLIGGGPWAHRVHAPAIAAHPRFELAGVWTRRPAVAAELAAGHGAAAFDDVAALIDAVDVVAVSVPPAVQQEIAVEAARAGRHLILEKPVGESLDGARSVADEVAAAGVASVVFLTFRFAPETRQWLDEVASAAPWSAASARWLSGALLGGEYAPSPWRQHHGALLDIGPHLFDLLDAALGRIVGVRGAARREPDLWQVMLDHEGGATSNATLSMRLPLDPSVLDLDVYGPGGRSSLAARQTPAPECFGTLLDELAGLIDRGERTHPCDVHRGVYLQSVIDDVLRFAP
jgi:predicted dehydrogenase